MPSINFIETETGARRIDPGFLPNQFCFDKISPYSTLGIDITKSAFKRNFPAGQFYALRTGLLLNSHLVHQMIEQAKLDTSEFNLKDDLPGGQFISEGDPNALPYWLTHAIEHSVVADILRRQKCIHPRPRLGSPQWGESVVLEAVSNSGEKRSVVGFHLRWGIASPKEIDKSIQLVKRRVVTQSILTSSTSKISVDPAGISPTALSP